MLKISTTTNKDYAEIITMAKDYFGPEGVGLHVNEIGEDCASFQGGGGYVSVTMCPKDGETEVELEGREWEHDMKKFISQV